MTGKVTIGCRLPHGLVLRHPMYENDLSKCVTLNGVNKAIIKGAHYATTEVDEEFWELWKAMNDKFPALLNGSLFVAKNANPVEVAAAAKDVEKQKTGLERMEPNSHGVKTVPKKDDD